MDGPYEALDGADCAVLITEWDQFRALNLKRMKSLLRTSVVVDLRNIYRPEEMAEAGFAYVSVGRPGANQ
jgi:UDPglucose 6-dehydrogenase